MNINLNEKQKKLAIITVIALFVVAIIAVAVFSRTAQKPEDEGGSSSLIDKVYDVAPESPYLIICFTETPKEGSASVDTSGAFKLEVISYNNDCVDFIINGGKGMGSTGKYDIYLSLTTAKNSKLDRKKVVVNVVTDLDNETYEVQVAAVNRNSSIYVNTLRQSDAIYEYLANSYDTDNYSIALQIGENDQTILLIHINMPKPNSANSSELALAENYKNEALNQIRAWGFDPDDYNVNIEYDDQF